MKFHKNRPSRLGCRAVTDRHTDRHTDTQTGRQPGSILTYSVKMTEYKNEHIKARQLYHTFKLCKVNTKHLFDLSGL